MSINDGIFDYDSDILREAAEQEAAERRAEEAAEDFDYAKADQAQRQYEAYYDRMWE